MFSDKSLLKPIRFEINPKYVNKVIVANGGENVRFGLGSNPTVTTKRLTLRITINIMEKNDEVFGYLAEQYATLATTTIELDKPVLLQVITDFYFNVDLYLHDNAQGITFLNTGRKDKNVLADEILAFLSEQGLY